MPIKIDAEGGNPGGAPDSKPGTKQANEAPENVFLPGPDANTSGALKGKGLS